MNCLACCCCGLFDCFTRPSSFYLSISIHIFTFPISDVFISGLDDISFHKFTFILYWRPLLQLEGLCHFLDPHHRHFYSVLNIWIWLLVWLKMSSVVIFFDEAPFPFLVCFPSPFESDSFQHTLYPTSFSNHICLSIFLFFFLSFACLLTQFWSFHLHLSLSTLRLKHLTSSCSRIHSSLMLAAKTDFSSAVTAG